VAFIPCRLCNHLHDFSISLFRHAAIFLRQLLQASLICDALYSFLADYGLAAVGNDWKGSRLPQRQTIYLDPFGGGDSLSRANRQTVIFKTIRGLVRLSRVPYLATMGEPASLH
jgi:hypothetical protein